MTSKRKAYNMEGKIKEKLKVYLECGSAQPSLFWILLFYSIYWQFSIEGIFPLQFHYLLNILYKDFRHPNEDVTEPWVLLQVWSFRRGTVGSLRSIGDFHWLFVCPCAKKIPKNFVIFRKFANNTHLYVSWCTMLCLFWFCLAHLPSYITLQ